MHKVALTTETKKMQNNSKTNPKQCFVSGALTRETKHWNNSKTFWDCFGVISGSLTYLFTLKNMQISKQFQRSQPITDDHTRFTLY